MYTIRARTQYVYFCINNKSEIFNLYHLKWYSSTSEQANHPGKLDMRNLA